MRNLDFKAFNNINNLLKKLSNIRILMELFISNFLIMKNNRNLK